MVPNFVTVSNWFRILRLVVALSEHMSQLERGPELKDDVPFNTVSPTMIWVTGGGEHNGCETWPWVSSSYGEIYGEGTLKQCLHIW